MDNLISSFITTLDVEILMQRIVFKGYLSVFWVLMFLLLLLFPKRGKKAYKLLKKILKLLNN